MKVTGNAEAIKKVKHLTNYLFLVAFIAVAFVLPVTESRAAELSLVERNVLVVRINALIGEVNRLQQLLNERRERAFVAATTNTDGTYKTSYYNNDVEIILSVENGTLRGRGSAVPRPVDRALFAMLNDTWGSEVVRKYVREFRVFSDDVRDIGAFIELKAGTDDWIVGVNRETYDKYHLDSPEKAQKFYAELFIHEYAHIVDFYNDDVSDALAERFWDAGDHRHAARVKAASGDERFALMSDHYRRHQDEFATDYATIHPDEDLAETFVEYVLADDTAFADDTLGEKIRFLHEQAAFRAARDVLRDQLGW